MRDFTAVFKNLEKDRYCGVPGRLYGPSAISRSVKGSNQCREGSGKLESCAYCLERKPGTYLSGQDQKAGKQILHQNLLKE